MGIKGEANFFKASFAESLQKLAENVDIVIGKKNTTINLEDKSRHLTINLNFSVAVSPSPEQIIDIVKRVKDTLQAQSHLVEDSKDPIFNSGGYPSAPILTDTASGALIGSGDYLFKGIGEPKLITDFSNLPCSIKVIKPNKIQ